MARAAAIMHERADEFARLLTIDMGKRIDEARGEVEFSSQILAYYAKNAERFLAPVQLNPTIGRDIAPHNSAFRQEFFGPVALFFRVADEASAIGLANDSDFGLGGSVFTRDEARGASVASRVETGMMFVNNISWSDPGLPFGGIKNSGYGRELGDMGIQEFVNNKLVRFGDIEAPPTVAVNERALVGSGRS